MDGCVCGCGCVCVGVDVWMCAREVLLLLMSTCSFHTNLCGIEVQYTFWNCGKMSNNQTKTVLFTHTHTGKRKVRVKRSFDGLESRFQKYLDYHFIPDERSRDRRSMEKMYDVWSEECKTWGDQKWSEGGWGVLSRSVTSLPGEEFASHFPFF